MVTAADNTRIFCQWLKFISADYMLAMAIKQEIMILLTKDRARYDICDLSRIQTQAPNVAGGCFNHCTNLLSKARNVCIFMCKATNLWLEMYAYLL